VRFGERWAGGRIAFGGSGGANSFLRPHRLGLRILVAATKRSQCQGGKYGEKMPIHGITPGRRETVAAARLPCARKTSA
jgi:hypothetical protein